MASLNNIDESNRIVNEIGNGLTISNGVLTADVLQSEVDAKQATIDSSNRLNANLIGDNGFVSNTEYGQLNGISANIQAQIDTKQATIDANNKLNANLIGNGINANLIADGSINNTDFENMLIKPGTQNSILRVPTFLSFNQNNGLLTQVDSLSDLFTAGTNITFGSGSLDSFTINSTSDAQYNLRNSQFFPTIGTTTLTKAAFDGAIMARALIHYGQTGSNPSGIVFGTKNVNSNNEISLITNGKVRFFTDANGTSYIGGSNDDVSQQIDSNNVYCLNIFNTLINTNANGLYVMAARARRVLRMDYQNNNGDFRSLEFITPNDGGNDADDFRLSTENSLRMMVSGVTAFLAGPTNGQFTVYNFNNISDDRIKSNEKPITNALESIMKLKPCTYDKYDNMEKTGASYLESGLISQDIWYDAPELRHLIDLGNYYEEDETGMKVNKNLIPTDIDNHEELNDTDFNPTNGWSDQHPSSVKYLGLIAYLIKAVQEQNQLIENLNERIKVLEG